MVCIYCGHKTEVFNSRLQKRNNNVWRRRRCPNCSASFTTHEQIDLTTSLLVDNNRALTPFNIDQLFHSLLVALKDNERPYIAARELSDVVTQKLIKKGSKRPILAREISETASGVLKGFSHQAWLRYIAEYPSAE